MLIDPTPLKDYLVQNIIKSKDSIREDDLLFSTGLVDSFGLLDLLFFIREQYGVSVEEYDIFDHNIDKFEDLVHLIESKK